MRRGPGATREPAGVPQLQNVSGHRLVHHEVLHHVPVVLAVERPDPAAVQSRGVGDTATKVGICVVSSGPGGSQ